MRAALQPTSGTWSRSGTRIRGRSGRRSVARIARTIEKSLDPFGWLEEIEGPQALDWARAENARSLPILESDPRFAAMRAEARAILTSPARIPTGSIHNGAVYNFWQDDVHVYFAKTLMGAAQ